MRLFGILRRSVVMIPDSTYQNTTDSHMPHTVYIMYSSTSVFCADSVFSDEENTDLSFEGVSALRTVYSGQVQIFIHTTKSTLRI